MIVNPSRSEPRLTEAASRISFDADPASAGGFDVSGLQALAASTTLGRREDGRTEGAARRGPFRPEVWLNARERHASRLAAHYFRAFDVLAVTAVTLLCAWASTPAPLLRADISQLAPFGLGALTVLGLMRSLGRYRFARGQRTTLHLASVAGIVSAGAVVAMASGWALQGARAQWPAWLVWSGLVLVSLYALHMGWSDMVGRWRASGALTPNIVLVGATRRAETLIREALKRRDLNVLGIFDDRLARAPEAVEGVPVLGTADDLLSHKMTPYVDRVVLAIDPRAEARVRELTARLRTLPNEVTLLVEPNGEAEPFATGFLPDGAADALARPAGLAVGGDGALYVSDDKAGFIYRIARDER